LLFAYSCEGTAALRNSLTRAFGMDNPESTKVFRRDFLLAFLGRCTRISSDY